MTIFRKLIIAQERAEFAEGKLEKDDLRLHETETTRLYGKRQWGHGELCMVFATPA